MYPSERRLSGPERQSKPLENKKTTLPFWKLWVTWIKSKLPGVMALFHPFDSHRISFNVCIRTELFWKFVLIKRNACDHILPCISVDSRHTYSFVHLFPLFMHGVWNNSTCEYIMHNLFLWGHWEFWWIILQLDDICSWRMRQDVPPKRLFIYARLYGATSSEVVTFTFLLCLIRIFCATQPDELSACGRSLPPTNTS